MERNLFHPIVDTWFRSAFGDASEVQEKAWPVIKQRKNALLAAPTGSGKTLAAFLSSIDDLVRQSQEGILTDATQVVYVSPLKALSNDIHTNLNIPLSGIQAELEKRELPTAPIRVAVRTGDTPPHKRTAMFKHPPHILVTTPESLYLLLTSENGRRMLTDVHTMIVDEIHAVVGNKRGAHLALSMERLDHLTSKPVTRIGISATQKPIDRIAHFLVGSQYLNGEGCQVIDIGHRRSLELDIETPRSPLTAVMSNTVWEEVFERLEKLILQHRTTLIFVTTRSLSERLARHLSERIGKDSVTAHHGSMAKEHRHDAERRLKDGVLKTVVTTASLELGIDIGTVDLVCQIGSPKSIAAFLQRVGRSGHTLTGTPRGRLFPLTRDDLVESAAILDAVRRREMDNIIIPEQPLDVLSQHIVAEVACEDYRSDDLFHLVVNAYPYRNLSRESFDDVITMLGDGYTPRRGRRGSYIHRDLMSDTLKGKKGGRLNALLNGGTIPDQFDYDVILEPSETFIGTLNEDFAIESTAGDIVQLGNSSWRILRVEKGKIRVEDAQGLPPTMPFWFGEAPGRSAELSHAVSRLRREVGDRLKDISDRDENGETHVSGIGAGWGGTAETWLMEELGLPEYAAEQIVTYLGTTKAALSLIPTQTEIVAERFFDEAGDMHLVVHSPFGSRVNRAWGLALRKRFCRQFNFELQAAANEDAIILSLGATHSFPLDEVFGYLNPASVRNVLTQALLDAPMFGTRWRWNASIALAVLRRRGGDRVPPQIQRSQAEDLIALVFPDQLACLENISGEREVPDHPLIRQTVNDCLHEAMDIESLESILRDIKTRKISVHSRDMVEPSPMTQEILSARPYAFLDDAPLEERRTNAVRSRRWIDPSEARDLGRLDPAAVQTIKEEAWPESRDPDELHDALILTGFFTEEEGLRGDAGGSWSPYFATLLHDRRAAVLVMDSGLRLWVPLERRLFFEKVFPSAQYQPPEGIPPSVYRRLLKEIGELNKETSLIELLRGRLEALGPVTVSELASSIGLTEVVIEQALVGLENQGFVFRGQFSPNVNGVEWCERRLLARITRLTISKLRSDIQPVTPADYMRFLFEWQHVAPGYRLKGPESVAKVLQTLEGVEVPAAAWENDILPTRVDDYASSWLDTLCLSGRYVWGRLRPFKTHGDTTKTTGPIKTTPIAIIGRANAGLWHSLSGHGVDPPSLSGYAKTIYELIGHSGALFFDDIVARTSMLRTHVEQAISELVSAGLLTSDSYSGLRALLVSSRQKKSRRHRGISFDLAMAGRWGVSADGEGLDRSQAVEAYARVALLRFGVVFRRLTERESAAPPWRDLVKVFRRLEMQGEIRGGRFIDGVWGEQYALSEAVTALRSVKRKGKDGVPVVISAADPTNLVGVLDSGKRVPALARNRILYRDGTPVMTLEGGAIRTLSPVDPDEAWALKTTIMKRAIPPEQKAHLGKGKTLPQTTID